jgi:hypothetical protein
MAWQQISSHQTSSHFCASGSAACSLVSVDWLHCNLTFCSETCSCRAIALETVSLGALTLAGPLKLYRGGIGLVARIPVYLDNQTAEEVRVPVTSSVPQQVPKMLCRAVSSPCVCSDCLPTLQCVVFGIVHGSSDGVVSPYLTCKTLLVKCIWQTYGMNRTASDCPQCYDPATGRKFWGAPVISGACTVSC